MNRPLSVSIVVLAAALLSPAASVAQPATAQAAPRPGAPAQASSPQPARPVEAQVAVPAPQPARVRAPTSLDVQVVISRYQGQKQISSLPYSLAVTANTNSEAQLNMGTDVPVPSTSFSPSAPADAGAKATPAQQKPLVSYSYRSVGTVITCRAVSGEDGRYEVTLSVDDSSVFTSEQASPPMPLPGGPMPVFRNFKTRNALLLQDGQTRRFTAAADRVSGETVQVEVTLRVVK